MINLKTGRFYIYTSIICHIFRQDLIMEYILGLEYIPTTVREVVKKQKYKIKIFSVAFLLFWIFGYKITKYPKIDKTSSLAVLLFGGFVISHKSFHINIPGLLNIKYEIIILRGCAYIMS